MLMWVARQPTAPGPLDGLRVAVKELVAIEGHELSANTPVPLPDRWKHPAADAAIVTRLRENGAAIVGTTTTHEFAWGITTYDRGRTVENPVQLGRIAGGSSGGSAEAVALGEADLGIGTDTAGSVRIPAAWCHLLGWKFTDGLVPMDGILPLAPGLDHPGLLASDPEVLMRAGAALGAGSAREQPQVLTLPSERLVNCDSRAVAGVEQTAEVLVRDHGFERQEAPNFPGIDELLSCFTVVQGAATLRSHSELIGTWPERRALYPDYIVNRLDEAEARSEAEVAEGQRLRATLRMRLLDITTDAVVVMPATGCGPPSTLLPNQCEVDGVATDLRSVVIPNTVPANIAGLPAVTVPFSSDGEEIGVQLLGGPGSDMTLLSMARLLMDPGWTGSF
ncbi:MAG: amidase [Acidimicrobiales bacterium]|nr:amidase [Acidimicrobiales bacterium]